MTRHTNTLKTTVRLLMGAFMAMMTVACTESMSESMMAAGDTTTAADGEALQFGTYIGRPRITRSHDDGGALTTRAGYEGNIRDAATLGSPSLANGFGVFGFFTGTHDYSYFRPYDAAHALYPNYMYNQQVYLDDEGQWTYSPLKYWPNEVTGETTYKPMDAATQGVDDQNQDHDDDPAIATGGHGGKVSFFAYAPWVAVTQQNAEQAMGARPVEVSGTIDSNSPAQYGIIALSGNAHAYTDDADPAKAHLYPDPLVSYKISNLGKSVDLLWGTKGNTSVNVNDEANSGVQGTGSDGTQWNNDDYATAILQRYAVNADLTKQKTTGRIEFAFKHATAKVGGAHTLEGRGDDEDTTTPTNGLMIVLDVGDSEGAETGGLLEPFGSGATDRTKYRTKVTVRNILLSSTQQVDPDKTGGLSVDGVAFDGQGTITAVDYSKQDTWAMKLQNFGHFNLATGQWSCKATTSDFIDGAAAGHKGINHLIVSPASDAVAEKPYQSATLSDEIAEPEGMPAAGSGDATYFTETLPIGVTTVIKNVYKDEATPLVFLPDIYPILSVEVDYCVRTYDAKLKGGYSEVWQKIRKQLVFTKKTELNKAYNLLIHLGLTGVRFTATVSDWDQASTTATTSDPATGETIDLFESDLEVFDPINVESQVDALTVTQEDNGIDALKISSAGLSDLSAPTGHLQLHVDAAYHTALDASTRHADVTGHVAYSTDAPWVHVTADGRVTIDENKDIVPSNDDQYNRTALITATYGAQTVTFSIKQGARYVSQLDLTAGAVGGTLTATDLTGVDGGKHTYQYKVKATIEQTIGDAKPVVATTTPDVERQVAFAVQYDTPTDEAWVTYRTVGDQTVVNVAQYVEAIDASLTRTVTLSATYYNKVSNTIRITQSATVLAAANAASDPSDPASEATEDADHSTLKLRRASDNHVITVPMEMHDGEEVYTLHVPLSGDTYTLEQLVLVFSNSSSTGVSSEDVTARTSAIWWGGGGTTGFVSIVGKQTILVRANTGAKDGRHTGTAVRLQAKSTTGKTYELVLRIEQEAIASAQLLLQNIRYYYTPSGGGVAAGLAHLMADGSITVNSRAHTITTSALLRCTGVSGSMVEVNVKDAATYSVERGTPTAFLTLIGSGNLSVAYNGAGNPARTGSMTVGYTGISGLSVPSIKLTVTQEAGK